MIYITEEQAAHVKYLLEQAVQGNHILFDSPTLKRVLETPDLPGAKKNPAVEPHIEKIMSLNDFSEMRAYLDRLDQKTFDDVARTYLKIVENTLFQAKSRVH